jgi:hypothetical protein
MTIAQQCIPSSPIIQKGSIETYIYNFRKCRGDRYLHAPRHELPTSLAYSLRFSSRIVILRKCRTPNVTPPSLSSPPTNAPSSARPGVHNPPAYLVTRSSRSLHADSVYYPLANRSHARAEAKQTYSVGNARSTILWRSGRRSRD